MQEVSGYVLESTTMAREENAKYEMESQLVNIRDRHIPLRMAYDPRDF